MGTWVLISGSWYYIQHNRQTDDGHSGLGKALQAMAKAGVTMKY